MADPALQALLDPGTTGTGIQIERRVDGPTSTVVSYYVAGQVLGVGKAQWVNVLTGDSDATKNTKIRTALGVA